MSHFKALFLLGSILWLTACNGSIEAGNPIVEPPYQPGFSAAGLNQHIVHRLVSHQQQLYAATDQGLYRHQQNDQWQRLTHEEWDIIDIAIVNDEHLLISYRHKENALLAESLDQGDSWELVTHNFGGGALSPADMGEPIRRLQYHEAKLYAVGYNVLAVSEDFGRNWQLLAGNWNAFATGMSALAINQNGIDIWYGGQGAIENPLLMHYRTDSMAYSEFPGIDELLPVPSTVKDIVFDPDLHHVIFITGEGGIIKTSDNGETWQALHTNEDYRFYFDLVLDPKDKNILYTAGWNKDYDQPQPLILERSEDGGQTWEQFQHPDGELFGGVHSMTVHQQHLYLGLYKGGVMRVSMD
ncbi:hypothetical protein [Lacimicrobium sp. SS2-24]|uniref:sialidase family protein n=1 Tax=Lacimicrobium sp. SS2-24 TaxID=2005569 RepID=UPI000B4B2D74|nr:hypothetical protein [Lacimicrobium sp. SS2-24]